MKMNLTIFITIYLVSFALCEAPEPVTTEVVSKKLNDEFQQKLKDEYNQEMADFTQSVEDAVNDHTSLTKVVKVGQFSITVQTECALDLSEIEIPEKPTLMEKECFTAIAKANSTAELIIQATPEYPPKPSAIVNVMNNCELEVSWSKSFSIFPQCWEGAMPEQYQAIYNKYTKNLTEEHGYSAVEGSPNTFTKSGKLAPINLEEYTNQKTLIPPVSTTSP